MSTTYRYIVRIFECSFYAAARAALSRNCTVVSTPILEQVKVMGFNCYACFIADFDFHNFGTGRVHIDHGRLLPHTCIGVLFYAYANDVIVIVHSTRDLYTWTVILCTVPFDVASSHEVILPLECVPTTWWRHCSSNPPCVFVQAPIPNINYYTSEIQPGYVPG